MNKTGLEAYVGTEPERFLWKIKQGRRVVQEQGIMQTAVWQNAYVPNGKHEEKDFTV